MLACSCCFCKVEGLACVGVLASPLLPLLSVAGGMEASDAGVLSAGKATEPPGGAAETAGVEPGVGSVPDVFGSGVFWHAESTENARTASMTVMFVFMVFPCASASQRSQIGRSRQFAARLFLPFDKQLPFQFFLHDTTPIRPSRCLEHKRARTRPIDCVLCPTSAEQLRQNTEFARNRLP